MPLYAPHDSVFCIMLLPVKNSGYFLFPDSHILQIPSSSTAATAVSATDDCPGEGSQIRRGGPSRRHLQDPFSLSPRRRAPLLRRRASLRPPLPRRRGSLRPPLSCPRGSRRPPLLTDEPVAARSCCTGNSLVLSQHQPQPGANGMPPAEIISLFQNLLTKYCALQFSPSEFGVNLFPLGLMVCYLR